MGRYLWPFRLELASSTAKTTDSWELKLMLHKVFIFTSLLFLSGYVLQQQTVRSIQAVIKPPPPPTPSLPPSPVLAKHFGTPPGHAFYDKYLASNRPEGGWAKAAYVQLVREHIHVCNAIMIFAALEREESMAQRIIVYPKSWNEQSRDRETSNSQLETSMRLLKNAASRYRVMLQPVEPMLGTGHGILPVLMDILSQITNDLWKPHQKPIH